MTGERNAARRKVEFNYSRIDSVIVTFDCNVTQIDKVSLLNGLA